MTATVTDEMTLEAPLAQHGGAVDDVRRLLHTQHHIGRAGQDHRFERATLITNRRELEFTASGIMGAQCPPDYGKHHVDRLQAPGTMTLLDLEQSGPVEVRPGIVCEWAGGHTEGSMNVLVETAEGTACICGDVIYDIQDQLADPFHELLAAEPLTTGNQAMTKRQEKGAIKKALNPGRFVLSIHDYLARVEGGRVVARLGRSVPGTEEPVGPAAAAHEDHLATTA